MLTIFRLLTVAWPQGVVFAGRAAAACCLRHAPSLAQHPRSHGLRPGLRTTVARSIRASIALALLASQVGAASDCTRVTRWCAARARLQGTAAKAAEIYEALTRQGESLEAEIGLVRASLQAGEFRKATSWATLVAGEHTDSVEAVALLAYLHDRAGYTGASARDPEAASQGSAQTIPPAAAASCDGF